MEREQLEKRIIVAITSALIMIFAVVLTFFITEGFFSTEPITTSTTSTTVATTEEEVTIPLSSIQHEFHTKEIIGRVVSEDFGFNVNLYWGTTKECLRYGAGIHKCSSLPGLATPLTSSSTCPIVAGHCMTDFQGFKILDPAAGEFTEGLTITFEMPYGDYVYEVKRVEVINADDFRFQDYRASYGNFDPNMAIFYTCYPFVRVDYTKYQRLFVFCELISGDKVVDDTLDLTTETSSSDDLVDFE